MSQDYILPLLHQALKQNSAALNGLIVTQQHTALLKLERPRNPDHGDYAVNVSFLAKDTRLPPPQIAALLQQALSSPLFSVSPMGGYLNFKLNETALLNTVVNTMLSGEPGKNTSMQASRINLEYVSANPTGPLHVGHGRWAALGDSLVKIFRHCGAFVTAEFYINDAGVQMNNIAISLFWRCVQQLKAQNSIAQWVTLPDEFPYPGEYVAELATQYLSIPQQTETILSCYPSSSLPSGSLNEITPPPAHILESCKAFCRETLLSEQQALLKQLHVPFDIWTSEQTLYCQNEQGITPVELGLKRLTEAGMTYEKEGALWFCSTKFGDEKDRVLRKSDGSYTYLTPDIAYHHDKYTRTEAYNCIMNIWGADHHGYVSRMRGAIEALGHQPEQFDVLLGQLVNLLVEGKRTRMGKRRKMLTLADVVDIVGVDATRFWMVSKSLDSTLDFDIELAASNNSENPVFYVQYAHARCCSILALATQPAGNIETAQTEPPLVKPDVLDNLFKHLTPEDLASLLSDDLETAEQIATRQLILTLDRFTKTVEDAARVRAPHFIVQYLQELAKQFHSFYTVCRIISNRPNRMIARLVLVKTIQKTLAQGLALIGVSAPEKM
jgi:arginyl-tRNA synthetase